MMEQFPEIYIKPSSGGRLESQNGDPSSEVNVDSDTLIMEDILIVDDAHEQSSLCVNSKQVKNFSSTDGAESGLENEKSYKYMFNDVSLTSLYNHVGISNMENNTDLLMLHSDLLTVESEKTNRKNGIDIHYDTEDEINRHQNENVNKLTQTKNESTGARKLSSARCLSPELDIVDELIKINILEKMKEKKNCKKNCMPDQNRTETTYKGKTLCEETVLLAGDSILNDIHSHMLSTKYKVEKIAFPRCSIGEIINGLTPLLSQKPKYVILHLGNNDEGPRMFESILEDLQLLKSYVMKCLPSSYVVTCYPMARNDGIKSNQNLARGLRNELLNNGMMDKVVEPNFTKVGNLRNGNALYEKSLDDITTNQKHERSRYFAASKNELVDLLVKKDDEIGKLTNVQAHEDKKSDHNDSSGVQCDNFVQKVNKEWMVSMYLDSLTQLRADSDDGCVEKVKMVEEKLQEVYRLRIRKTLQTCNENIAKMKKEYEEEIRKLKSKDFIEDIEVSLESYMKHLDKSMITLQNDTNDDTKFQISINDSKDNKISTNGKVKRTDDELSLCETMDKVKTKEQYQEVPTNAKSSIEPIDIEQNVIEKVKESIIKMFGKSEEGAEDGNVLFRLDAVEEILQENYAKITDMTDKLKEKLCAIEKDMIHNFNNIIQEKEREFNNTIQEKELEFGEKKNALIFKTKNNILEDISGVFTELINKQVHSLDDKMAKILAQHKEDMKSISQGHSAEVVDDDDNYYDDEDKHCVTNANTLDTPSEQEESAIWNEFFNDKNSIPQDVQSELANKKVEFKSCIEKNLNILTSHVTRSIIKAHEHFAQFNEKKAKQFQQQLEEVKKQHAEELSERRLSMGPNAKAEHIGKLRNLQKQYEKDHTDQVRKLSDCKQNHRAEVHDLKKQRDDFVENLRQEHTEKMENLKNVLQSEKFSLLDDVNELEENVDNLENEMGRKSEKLDKISKQKDEIEDLLSLKETYISELEEQLKYSEASIQHQVDLLADAKAKLAKERDKYAQNYKTLSEEKAREHDEEIGRVKTKLEDVVQKQIADIGKLGRDKVECKAKIDEQRVRLCELEVALREEKLKSSHDLGESTKGKSEGITGFQDKLKKTKHGRDELMERGKHNDAEARKLQEKFKEIEKLVTEGEQDDQLHLKNLIREMGEQITSLQNKLENRTKKNEKLEDMNKKYVADISRLKDMLREMELHLVDRIEEKQTHLDNIKNQLLNEKTKQEANLGNTTKDITESHKDVAIENERYTSELVVNVGATQEDFGSEQEQDLMQNIRDNREQYILTKKQKDSVCNLENSVLEQARAELIPDLKREINKLLKKISIQERELKRKEQKEDYLRERIEHQRTFIAELEAKLSPGDKSQELCKLAQRLDEEQNRDLLDYEQSSGEIYEAMLSIKEVFEEEIQEKESLNDYADEEEARAEHLNEQSDRHEPEIIPLEKQDADVEEPSWEKSSCISDMERLLEEELQRRDEITNFVKRQSTVLGHIEKQIHALKTKLIEKEDQLNQLNESYTTNMETSESENEELAMQLHVDTTTNAPKENQHIQALEKLQSDFENATKDRQQQISMLEISIANQMKQTGEVKEILKRQQIMVCELGHQLNKQKCVTSLQKKEMGEVREAITHRANTEIPELRRELSEVKERSMTMENILQKHIRESNEKHAAMNNVRKLKQKLLNIEQKMMNESEEFSEPQTSHHEMSQEPGKEYKPYIRPLVETPQRDKTSKLDPQREADDALDLEIDISDHVNERSSLEQIEKLKGTWLQEKDVLLSIIDDMRKNRNERFMSQTNAVSYTNMSTSGRVDGHQNIKDALLHENPIVSEFKTLLNKESNVLEASASKSDEDEEVHGKKKKTVDHELTFEEKYLNVTELPQKENNTKEVQSEDFEKAQNLNTSLMESYAIVSELDNFLTIEKEKIDLINSKLDNEKYEKSSMPASVADKKPEIKVLKDGEICYGNDKLREKVKSLKAWEVELKKRESSLAVKEEKVKRLLTRIEQGCDMLPQKEAKYNETVENKLDTDYRNNTRNKDLKLSPISIGLQPDKGIQDYVTADGQKLISAGWTQTKLQRLYLKYFRAETFRKNLAYQKHYLTYTLSKNEPEVGSGKNCAKTYKRKYTFKVVVLTIISIRRMKYLVVKYHRHLYKSSIEYHQKDKTQNIFNKKRGEENAVDDDISSNENTNLASKSFYSANTSFDGDPPNLFHPTKDTLTGNLCQPQPKYLHALV